MKIIKKIFICLYFLFICINSNTLLVSAEFGVFEDLRFVKNPVVMEILKSKVNFKGSDFISLWEIANPGTSREGLVVDNDHILYTVCLNNRKEVDEILICVPIIDTTIHNHNKVVCEASLSAQPSCSLYLIDVAQLLVFGNDVNNLIFSEEVDTQYFLHEPSELPFMKDLNDMLLQVAPETKKDILILLIEGQDVGKGIYASGKLGVMNVYWQCNEI
ncbi:MAG: hypothetical protein LBF32_03385 [Streptococcaceae bacterium]|jgi:hypothetical protein|nr:hypothetical protein [Streptococcaceae bacterium]